MTEPISGPANLPLDLTFSPSPGVALHIHDCRKPRGGWSPVEQFGQHTLVLVRSGGFQIRLNGREDYLGRSAAYFESRGAEYQIRHPTNRGDSTAMFSFTDEAFERHVRGEQVPARPIFADGAIELSHRQLVRALDRGIDAFEAQERIATLIGRLLKLGDLKLGEPIRPSTRAAHARIVRHAIEAVTENPFGVALTDLADALEYSPFHVSRVFKRSVGMTLTRFRNRVRVATVLASLEQGEHDLAGLANHLGFTDQAHMTRVLRAETGLTPARAREVLHRSEP